MSHRCYCPLLLALSAAAAPLSGQTVRGRVVDEASRQPVAEVTVILRRAGADTVAVASSDRDGFFTLPAPSRGDYELSAQRVGYAAQQRQVRVNTADLVLPALVLRAQAIPLDSVSVAVHPGPIRNDPRHDLTDVESVELVPPAAAAMLYGMGASASGALVVWTRRTGPHRSDARTIRE